MKLKIILFLLTALTCNSAFAETFYIRPDGGDSNQCSGLVDAPLRADKQCAFNHPFWANSPQGSNPTKMTGGDTMIIGPGQYMMGLGAPNANDTAFCYPNWSEQCFMRAIPSGTAANPTRILGKGWDTGCSVKPQLWGTERSHNILDLRGSSNIEIQCLDITDHSECMQNGPVPCERSAMPRGPWAETGIVAADSANVLIKNVEIHGLFRGVWAARLKDWTLENVDIIANSFVGWDGDMGASTSSNSGKIHFKNTRIKFSGCGQRLDGTPHSCYSQDQGGYGDGIGTEKTGGDWVFDNSDVSNNVSDGLDLLYHNGQGSVTLENSKFENNAGNQVKVAANTVINNTKITGDCGWFSGQSITMAMWNGAAFNNCRAGGQAIAAIFRAGTKVSITGGSVSGNGDVLVMSAGTECNGTESLNASGTVFTTQKKFFNSDLNKIYYAAGNPVDGNGNGPCGQLKMTFDNTPTPTPTSIPSPTPTPAPTCPICPSCPPQQTCPACPAPPACVTKTDMEDAFEACRTVAQIPPVTDDPTEFMSMTAYKSAMSGYLAEAVSGDVVKGVAKDGRAFGIKIWLVD